MSNEQESFLLDVTQDENVYLLGLLWADGSIGKKYDIRLELKESDFFYIEPLLKKYGFTKFGVRQRYNNNKKFGNIQKVFAISRVILNEKLRSWGYRNKSQVAPSKILSVIPSNKHYLWWRGFFDGDGCFYCRGAEHTFAVWGSINQDWSELKSLLHKLNIKSFRHEEFTERMESI